MSRGRVVFRQSLFQDINWEMFLNHPSYVAAFLVRRYVMFPGLLSGTFWKNIATLNMCFNVENMALTAPPPKKIIYKAKPIWVTVMITIFTDFKKTNVMIIFFP
jgi:hypothetical protein